MLGRMRALRIAATAATVLAAAGAAAIPARAAQDRVAPSAPGSFKAVAAGAYSVSLTWSPSSDNSGHLSYVLGSPFGPVTLPQATTSYTWRTGLLGGYGYTFTIKAVDPSGNASKTVSAHVVLPTDTTAPSAPTVQVTGSGPTSVSLAWTASTEDGPSVSYSISGAGRTIDAGSATAYTVTGLAPGTTYSFTVQARDIVRNVSPPSSAVTVTTPLSNPPDSTPPTVPANLDTAGMVFSDGETWLFWTQSTDDITPQALIAYRVIVNGVLDHVATGVGRDILYVPTGRSDTIELVAVDEAGNASAPATIVVTP